MKRFISAAVLLLVFLIPVSGQDMDVQIALTNQALNRNTLERLDLSDDEIDMILDLQDQLRILRQDTGIDMNVIKAQLARELHKTDSDEREIFRLLEDASGLRLELEKAQVRTYLRIREELGKDNWSVLLRQARNRQQNPPRRTNGAPEGAGDR